MLYDLSTFVKSRDYMKKNNNNVSLENKIWVKIQILLRNSNFQNSQNYVVSKKMFRDIEAKVYANEAYAFMKGIRLLLFILIMVGIFTHNLR